MEDKRFYKYLPNHDFLHTAFIFNGLIYDYVPKIEGGFRCLTKTEFNQEFDEKKIEIPIENDYFYFHGTKLYLNTNETIQNRIDEIKNKYKNNELMYRFYSVQCTSVVLYILSSNFDYFINPNVNDSILSVIYKGNIFFEVLKTFIEEIKIDNDEVRKFKLFLKDNIDILYEDENNDKEKRLIMMLEDLENISNFF